MGKRQGCAVLRMFVLFVCVLLCLCKTRFGTGLRIVLRGEVIELLEEQVERVCWKEMWPVREAFRDLDERGSRGTYRGWSQHSPSETPP